VASGACGCAPQAKDTVADAVQRTGGPPAPAPAELLLVLSPLLLYGIFTLYRSKVNPRAKLQDFAFIVVSWSPPPHLHRVPLGTVAAHI
jgi:hypothetical protein